MHDECFRDLMRRLDEMSDDEFVRILEESGMVVEDVKDRARLKGMTRQVLRELREGVRDAQSGV